MKYIYLLKYTVQSLLATILVIFGFPPPVYETFFDKTCDYFTKPNDVRRAFKKYLADIEISEKPYFLKDGFELKAEFKLSVIQLSDEELRKKYPLSRP